MDSQWLEEKLAKRKQKPKQVDKASDKYKSFKVSFDGTRQFVHTNASYDLPNESSIDNANIEEQQPINGEEANFIDINSETRKLNINEVLELISNELPRSSVELV